MNFRDSHQPRYREIQRLNQFSQHVIPYTSIASLCIYTLHLFHMFARPDLIDRVGVAGDQPVSQPQIARLAKGSHRSTLSKQNSQGRPPVIIAQNHSMLSSDIN